MSTKACDLHKHKWRKRIRRGCVGLLICNFIFLVLFLIIWAILQPKKPRFILQDVTINSFNISSPNFLSSNFQVTIASRNPNDKIGVYYDKLDVYATYRNQQITYFTSILPVYQGHKDVNVWSPLLYGTNIPIAPYNGVALSQDQASGAVSLIIKLNGRVRWKVGTFVSGRYRLHISCPVTIPFGGGNTATGVYFGNAVKYQIDRGCRVSL